jgi:hypothetical protein
MQSTPHECARAALVRAVVVMPIVLCALSACERRIHFTEEVQLADGEVIKVDRRVAAAPLGEIGGPGGWESKYMSLEIIEPMRPENPPKWESTAGLVPVLFDKDADDGEWALLATFYTCEAWYALGRPKLPYVEFRARAAQWQKVELSAQWSGRPTNVLTHISSGGEPEFIGLPAKRERMSDSLIAPEYRSIVDRWTTGC